MVNSKKISLSCKAELQMALGGLGQLAHATSRRKETSGQKLTFSSARKCCIYDYNFYIFGSYIKLLQIHPKLKSVSPMKYLLGAHSARLLDLFLMKLINYMNCVYNNCF